MSKKIEAKKVPAKIKSPVKKVKVPKFKLITYTIKAVIPTGMYANIQPEVTVQAESIEVAERAVMPHIEALFAKYREGGSPVATPQPAKPVAPAVASPVTVSADVPTPMPVVKSGKVDSKIPKAPETVIVVAPAPPTIIMTVPFTRAKGAIDSCMSKDALKLVADQIEKSVKLIPNEKNELNGLIKAKAAQLDGNQKAA